MLLNASDTFFIRRKIRFNLKFNLISLFCDLSSFDRRNAFLLLHFTFFWYKESRAKNAGQDASLFNPKNISSFLLHWTVHMRNWKSDENVTCLHDDCNVTFCVSTPSETKSVIKSMISRTFCYRDFIMLIRISNSLDR